MGEIMMERLSGEKMLSQDDVVVYHRTLSLLMECARKAQLLSDTVNQDAGLPQSPAEIAAKSALQRQLAAICMECLEKSQSLAEKFGSIKDDECSTLRTMSPRNDGCS